MPKKKIVKQAWQEIWEYGNPDETNFKELNRLDSFCYYIPLEIIKNHQHDLSNETRVAVFCYLYAHKIAYNDTVFCSLENMCNWCGKSVPQVGTGILMKFLDSLFLLEDMGYITLKERPSKYTIKHPIEIVLNFEAVTQSKKNGFATIYNDEIIKLLTCKKPNIQKHSMTDLLLFAYLRSNIFQRPNRINKALNTQNLIEAYNCFEKNIIDDIGITRYYFEMSAPELKELGFIYFGRMMDIKIYGTFFQKGCLIFVNQYKREGKYVLASGESYYMNEYKKKENRMRQLLTHKSLFTTKELED